MGYLPTVHGPATNMSTVYELLHRTSHVFAQALYAKTAEVIWKQPQQFSHIVLRFSVLHNICNCFAVIGKRFEDAGLRNVAI